MDASTIFIPANEREAVQWIIPALDRAVAAMPEGDLKKAWHAIAYLYGGLHPDSAIDHGDVIANDQEDPERFMLIDPRLIGPYYVRSGWPLVLVPIADEAWLRYSGGRLKEDEFYCCEATVAGIVARMDASTSLSAIS